MLALLDENGADRHVSGAEVVHCNEELPRGDVDRVLHLELKQSGSGGLKRRVPN